MYFVIIDEWLCDVLLIDVKLCVIILYVGRSFVLFSNAAALSYDNQ